MKNRIISSEYMIAKSVNNSSFQKYVENDEVKMFKKDMPKESILPLATLVTVQN
jgi:hypothetical protein